MKKNIAGDKLKSLIAQIYLPPNFQNFENLFRGQRKNRDVKGQTRVAMMESEMKKWPSGIRRREVADAPEVGLSTGVSTGTIWPEERARVRAAGLQWARRKSAGRPSAVRRPSIMRSRVSWSGDKVSPSRTWEKSRVRAAERYARRSGRFHWRVGREEKLWAPGPRPTYGT